MLVRTGAAVGRYEHVYYCKCAIGLGSADQDTVGIPDTGDDLTLFCPYGYRTLFLVIHIFIIRCKTKVGVLDCKKCSDWTIY